MFAGKSFSRNLIALLHWNQSNHWTVHIFQLTFFFHGQQAWYFFLYVSIRYKYIKKLLTRDCVQGLTPPAAGTFVGGVQWMRENSFWTRPLTAARVRPLLWIFSKSFTRSNGSSIISTWSSWWSSSSPYPHAKTVKNNTTPIQEQNRWSIFQNEHCTCWITLAFFFFFKERNVFKSTPACAWDIKVYWLWRHRNTALLWRIPRRFKLIYSRVDCVTHPCVTMNVRRFPWVIDIRYLAGDLLFFDHVLHIHYT